MAAVTFRYIELVYKRISLHWGSKYMVFSGQEVREFNTSLYKDFHYIEVHYIEVQLYLHPL